MNLGINDRCAVVLASSAGLGRAVAMTLAEEGVRVAISGRDPNKLAATLAEMNR